MKTKNRILVILVAFTFVIATFFMSKNVQAEIYKGIDIYNGNGVYDYNAIKNDGVQVVIHKATEGTTFVDKTLKPRYLSLVNNFKLGYYHFARNTGNPEQQAQNFLNVIEGLHSDTVLWLDIENTGDWSKQESINFTNRFVNYVKNKGKPIGIYTGLSFYYEYLQANIDSSIPIWLASYGRQPVQFPNVVSWQYSETGRINGISGYVDMNYFNDSIFTGVKPNSQSVQVVKPQIQLSTEQIIQTQLNTVLGCNLSIDGVIGEQTRQQIRVFQTVAGIRVDGVWGPQCANAISQIYSKPTLKQGNNNNRIATRLVQYRMGTQFDGSFGTITNNHVKGWQQRKGISVDGIVGSQSWNTLFTTKYGR